jgi:hypothetical protein
MGVTNKVGAVSHQLPRGEPSSTGGKRRLSLNAAAGQAPASCLKSYHLGPRWHVVNMFDMMHGTTSSSKDCGHRPWLCLAMTCGPE